MTDLPGRTATTTAAGRADEALTRDATAAEPSAPRPESADGGEARTLVEMLERAVGRSPRPDLLNYKRAGEWRSISSTEFLERARAVALGLSALGLRRGDRVAIL
ncbi:MAG TPA: hypothetical protein VF754_02755, partial [Pyrinomonadaceae bacterium]